MSEEVLFEELDSGETPVEKKDNNDVNIDNELRQVAEEVKKEDTVFDYNELSDTPGIKYERVELDGQTVTISKAVIEYPPENEEWQKTLNGESFFKQYIFRIEFDTPNNDREFLSGLKGFKQENGELSKPSLYRQGKNQVALLFKAYKKKILAEGNVTEKEFEEKYGLKQLMMFLNSRPKALIETVDIDFNNKITRKNLVKEFI